MRVNRLLGCLVGGVGAVIGCAVAVWIVLWVSLRSSAVKVPNVTNMDMGHATAVLQEQGLVVRPQEGIFDAQVEAGRVARQRPAAGFEIKRGAVLLIYPSLGKAVQKISDLTGLALSLAENEIDNLKLTLDKRAEIEGQSDGLVIVAQAPMAGTLVATNSGVSLLINRSARSKRYVMPDFVGINEADATRVLRSLGFQLAEIQRVSYPGSPIGSVLRQEPSPGGPVTIGAVVGLWVSR